MKSRWFAAVLPLPCAIPLPPCPFPPSKRGMTANADRPTALLASTAEAAQSAESLLRDAYDFVPLDEAEQVIALGGDGFLLQTLHEMLNAGHSSDSHMTVTGHSDDCHVTVTETSPRPSSQRRKLDWHAAADTLVTVT